MEKTIVKMSPSSLNDLQSCMRLYNFNKLMRLQPLKKERALDYGGLMHYMIHPWRFGQIKEVKDHHKEHPYARLLGLPLADLNHICREIGKFKSFTTDLSGEDRNKAQEKFTEYTEHHRGLGWEFLEVEQPFSIKIHEDEECVIILQGIIDALANIPKEGKTVVDTKTSSRETYTPVTDNQLMGIGYAFNIKNFIIDRIYDRKEKCFVIDRKSFLTEQKEEWLEATVYWVKQGLFFMQNNYFPPNFSSCKKFGGCRYMGVCEVPPSAREFKLNSLFRAGSGSDIYRVDPLIPEILDNIFSGRKSA